jgi:hypothetical protein
LKTVALIVHGAGLGDRLRLIERLATDVPAGDAITVMLTSPRIAAVLPGLHLPPRAVVHAASGGCPCCIGRVTLQVTLVKLLRESRPRRLFIELAGNDHLRRTVAALAEGRLADALCVAGTLQAHPL